MNTAMRSTFLQRLAFSQECEEQVLGRELSDFECEGLEYHVAGKMVDEGLITDTNEVIV